MRHHAVDRGGHIKEAGKPREHICSITQWTGTDILEGGQAAGMTCKRNRFTVA